MSLAFRPVTELAAMVADGGVSARELSDFFLDRIRRFDPSLHAFITVMEAAPPVKGPLTAIPYACKDMIQARGAPTTAGSRVLAAWVPDEDAAVVDRMAAAGAVLLGKNNQHEFAYGATGENPHYGTVPNPYDRSRLAGGSSSGSAAAVAAGLVPAALGTDTGGSVRVPAALCGVVGFKPTLGLISTDGVVPYCWTLDHVGTLTRTVGDAVLVLAVLTGDPVPARRPVAGLRIGLPRRFFFERADTEITNAVRRVLAVLEGAGARVVEVDLPAMDHARTVSLTVQLPEALSYHSRYLDTHRDLYGADILAGLASGQYILAEHYVRAKRFIHHYRTETDKIFDAVDVIVTPSTPVTAPETGATEVAGEAVGNAVTRYSSFFNMTGHPALTVPCGLHPNGLPMGVQIIGRHFDEATVLSLGVAIEADPRCAVPPPPDFAD